MVNKMRSFIRRPTGNQFCGEEYFNGSGVAGQSLTLGHIPFRELDLVEYHNGTSWVEIFRGSATTDYALSGSEDLLDRYIWMGSGITVTSSDTGNIHASYRIRSLTVNTEMTINVGEIISNVEASFSDASNVSKKALVDTDRHPQNDVLTANITTVNSVSQTGRDWSLDFQNISEDTGNISIYTGLISSYTEGISLSLDKIDMYTEGISLSLDNIDMYTEGISLSLDNISAYTEGISLSLDNIDAFTGQTASYTEGISLSLDSIDAYMGIISNTRLPTVTTTSGNFKVAILEELPAGTKEIGFITLAVGDSLVGRVKISDGTTVANVDAGTGAILVKEVTGAVEIANVNITSVSGTIQTAGDWTPQFNLLTNISDTLGDINTDLDTSNTKLQNISDSLGGVATSLISIDTDLDTVNTKLQAISDSVGGIAPSLISIDTDLDTTNTKLQAISDSVGGIAPSLISIDSDLDTTNTKLQAISDSVGGIAPSLVSIDTDLDTTNTKLQAISNSVGGIAPSLISIDTDLDTTNTKLQAISNSVGGINPLLTSIETKTQNISNTVGSIDSKITVCDTTLLTNISDSIGGIAPSLVSIDGKLTNISDSVGGIAPSLVSIDTKIVSCNTGTVTVTTNSYPPNADSWTTGQVTVIAVGTVVQFPSVVIPDGFYAVIKAKASNIGTISLGDNATKALSTSTGHYTLLSNEGKNLGINNLNLVFMDAWVAGEGIEYATEAS